MKKLLLLIVFALSLTMNAQYGCEIMTYGCIHINAYNNTQCVGGTITVTGYVNTNNSSCNNTHWASCRNYNFSVSPNGSGTNTSVTGSTSYFSINITSTVAGTRNYTLNVSNSADLANGIQAGVDNASTSISVTFTNPTTLTIGSITGSSPVCQSQNNVIYTVPVVPNASSYTWTLPSGASGTSSTNSISMNYGANAISGNITVKAACDEDTKIFSAEEWKSWGEKEQQELLLKILQEILQYYHLNKLNVVNVYLMLLVVLVTLVVLQKQIQTLV